jgi:hypothetical protein
MKVNIFLIIILVLGGCTKRTNKNDAVDSMASQQYINIESNQSVEDDHIPSVEDIHLESNVWHIPSREEYGFFSKDEYAHIRDGTCAKIIELYEDIMYAEQAVPYSDHLSYGINYEDIDNAKEMIPKLMVDFFRTEESWSIDMKKELPFISDISISQDNMVRIYSWDYMESATGDTFNNIIQYKAESGIINAVQIGGLGEHAEPFRQLGLGWGPSYGIGFKIEEQVYLIWSHARAGGFMSSASFSAIKLLDEKIESYMAFNGDNKLKFSVGTQYGGVIDNFAVQFNKTPLWIKIIFNVRESSANNSQWTEDPDIKYAEPYIYDILEFSFNGTEFLGDYAKFNEITKR